MWLTWRASEHFAVCDAASTGTLCGVWRGEHRYTMRCVTRQAPVHYAVYDGREHRRATLAAAKGA